MTILPDYHQFDGRYWEIGTIRNVLDYQGVKAPHTGQPFTEAMLFGISGGIVAGYFTFEYQGHEPWLHFLTRNSLDPMGRLIERLGIPTQVKQTAKPDIALKNLTETLTFGQPAIVWAEMMSLPYNRSASGEAAGANMSIVVYGFDGDTVYIADRARVPLTVSADDFATARGRSASNKHRLMTLGEPDTSRLISAVEFGILACAAYMLDEAPLKPMKGKFGLDAFTRWADLLVSTKKDGWAKTYPGAKLFSVLESCYRYINLWGTDRQGGRGHYADFLDEAAIILGQPALNRVAESYREAGQRWDELNLALLPDSIRPFRQIRDVMDRQKELFLNNGGDSVAERQKIGERLEAIRAEIKGDIPLSDGEASALRDNLRDKVLAVQEAERTAAFALRRAMG
jgi:hypothetical protein